MKGRDDKVLAGIKKKLKSFKLTKINLGLIAVVIMFLVMGIAVLQSYVSIGEKQKEYDELVEQYNVQLMQNAELTALLEESDDEYIERVARERLDLVYPGERVFINSSGN